MKKKAVWALAALVLAVMALSGCISAKYLVENWEPGRIAVLPFRNESADVAVEKFARAVMVETLTRYDYEVVDVEEVDAKLDALGITEGGQLEAVTLAELAQAIPADSFLYGDVLEAKRVMIGIYFNKKFTANFKVFDVRSEELKWEDERTSKEQKVVLNPVEMGQEMAQQFALELTSDLIYKALNSHPLIQHIRTVVRTSVRTLP
jgi:hypothetical protein